MDGESMLKAIYRHFGVKKPDNQEMYSIANVLYEMGKENEGERVIDGSYQSREKVDTKR